ncbi:MAG TPA: DUF2314 domain-containing protein [Cyclobacteriaceae bacterium]|nr:DUF2314 domain-containing protein [Cyclobacteriaceae bacterium]
MPRNSIVSCIIAGVICCAASSDRAVPKVPVLSPYYVTPILIYLLDNEKIDTTMVAKKAAKDLVGFKRSSRMPESLTFDAFNFELNGLGDDNFMQPDLSVVDPSFMAVSKEEYQSFGVSSRALAFWFYGQGNKMTEKNASINKFIRDITVGKRVVILDFNAFKYYNNASWKENRVDPFVHNPVNIGTQVAIHTFREGEYCRSVTMGMMKFALPEISVKGFPCSNSDSYISLVNVAMQTLLEDPFIGPDSVITVDLKNIKNVEARDGFIQISTKEAGMKAAIKFKRVQPEEGDNAALQFAISFESKEYASPIEEGNAIVTGVFGSFDDVMNFEHDEEIIAASNRAKAKLPSLKKKFKAGFAPGESLLLKMPFKTPDDTNEWMWVEITVWTDSVFKGILQNDPVYVQNLQAGALVDIKEADMFDYILMKSDGSYEGNETGEIMERRRSKH